MSGDAERYRSELLEPLSAGAWDFTGDPTPDSLPKPDPDELELLEPTCSLNHFLTQSWNLKKRNLTLSLESDGLEMSGAEDVTDYEALVNKPHADL